MANVIEKAEDYLSSATISHEMLQHKLSEFLAVERGGLKLYEQALRIVSDSDLRKKFSEFRDQTRKHETILIRVIHALGMDPAYLSPSAKLATEKADALLKTMRTAYLPSPPKSTRSRTSFWPKPRTTPIGNCSVKSRARRTTRGFATP